MELDQKHLQKIPASISEETLTLVLETLWNTRRSGLSPAQKSHLRSLLLLPDDFHDLGSVLASLRSIIRKCVHEDLTADDIQKLLPLDLSSELQSILLMLLQKYQSQWKEDALKDQPLWKRTRVSCQVRVDTPTVVAPCAASKLSSKLWSRPDDATILPKSSSHGDSFLSYGEPNIPSMAPSSTQHQSKDTLDSVRALPRLKSMTWTMQHKNLTPSNRVAVITLKLQDYTNSPSGEIEVKFQLSKDTLDAMLRSMNYVSEQLSNSGNQPQPSEQSSKKQRQ